METQSALSAKREASEYQLRAARLQDEVNILQRNNDQLTTHNHSLERTVSITDLCVLIDQRNFILIFVYS